VSFLAGALNTMQSRPLQAVLKRAARPNPKMIETTIAPDGDFTASITAIVDILYTLEGRLLFESLRVRQAVVSKERYWMDMSLF
jgi:hypothetical protein